MKLLQALKLVNGVRNEPSAGRVFLACGCTPLNLTTFLGAIFAAELKQRFEFTTGLYGDLIGNVRRMRDAEYVYRFVIVEWSDLDPRLGYRVTGGWRTDRIYDIVDTVRLRGAALSRELVESSESGPVCIVLPTLPLPPLFPPAAPRAHTALFQLFGQLQQFASELAEHASLRVIDSRVFDQLSPARDRHNLRDEWATGFPYQLEHAYHVCQQLVRLAERSDPKRGIITDLDNTLWRGILGEDGVQGISWHLEKHTFGHALYQEMLVSLAEQGVLLAVASKNDLQNVQRAFERPDLVLEPDRIFPIHANWGPKSQSVGAILNTWNIGPDAVVFIDDNPMELAEVSDAFPTIECLPFPTHDESGILDLLWRLRDQFGRLFSTKEDKLRLKSLRDRAQQASYEQADPDAFLRDLQAQIRVSFGQCDERALELINKTNQFNLNGVRWSDAEWHARTRDSARFLLSVAYGDKFGPLGKVSVLAGSFEPEFTLDTWVLSCRAFSRRIEFQTLLWLFEFTQRQELQIHFAATPRNGPLREFLQPFVNDLRDGRLVLTRSAVQAASPPCFAEVIYDE